MRLILICILSLFLVSVASETSEETDLLEQVVGNLKSTFGCSASIGGYSVDISSLTSTTDFSAIDTNPNNKYTYYFNPCGVANANQGKCITGQSTMCQSSGPTNGANLGSCTTPATGSPVQPRWELNSTSPLSVKVTYLNGDSCSNGNVPTKLGIVVFTCDPKAGRGYVVGTVTESPPCVFTMNIVTSHICPGGGSSSGLSGGWVFIIILIVCIFLYIVAGCVYQRKKKGASGMESFPNIEFWRGLPGLVKEGFSFTWTKLRGLCGKGEYTEVK